MSQMMEMLTRMDIKMDITQEEMKEMKASIDSLNESFSGLKEEGHTWTPRHTWTPASKCVVTADTLGRPPTHLDAWASKRPSVSGGRPSVSAVTTHLDAGVQVCRGVQVCPYRG
ncbi:hypothetical protein ACOMHN_045821 [Nucella lapillus]